MAFGEDAVCGVEAVVEEAPVQVELEAGGAALEGEVFPKAGIGCDAIGCQAACRVDDRVAELTEESDLLSKAAGLGEDVDVANVA